MLRLPSAILGFLAAAATATACGTATSAGAPLDATSEDDAALADATGSDALGDTIGADVLVGDTASTDAAKDAAVDAVADSAADAGTDAVADVALDAGSDAATDAGTADVSQNCGDFATPPATSPTSVIIVNQTASNIYLGPAAPHCQYDLGFDVASPEGAPLIATYGACDFTCGQLQSQGCGCPPVACQPPIVTLLAPGKQIDYGWTGTVFDTKSMPAACYQDASCLSKSCLQEVAAPKASVVAVNAYPQALCNGVTCPDCTPGGNGTCTVSGATSTGGTAAKVSATWNGQAKLQIVFK